MISPRALLPRTVTGQVVLLAIVCVVLAQAIGIAGFYLIGFDRDSPPEYAGRVATVLRVLAALPPEARPAYARAANDADRALALRAETAPPPTGATDPAPPPPGTAPPDGERLPGDGAGPGAVRELRARLGPGFVVALPPRGPDGPGRILLRLPDGRAWSVAAPAFRRRLLGGPIVPTLAFLAAALALFGGWAARAVTTPLRRLAAAVETAAPDGLPGAIPVDGPAEVRAVATAIAANTDRIRALMADNARTLAAVGHDLRTPLTRLRLRVDFVEDDDVRAALVADLDYMTALTEEALAHLRGSGRQEPAERVDVGSLLSTVVDRFADLDADVRADLPAGLEAPLRPNAVQRAVRNLVENALRHAGHARVSARRAGRHVVIAVADEGPGIPPEDRERLVRPFERGDAARTSGSDHGLGLGLSIARDVAVSHGGRLVLGDNVPTGLIATLELPVADAAAD